MADTTTNYHLKKPSYEDYGDVKDLNDNMDTIDSVLYAKAEKSEAVSNITRAGLTFTATKANGATFTFTQQDTTYSNATTSAAGLMSAADKTKLNGIANNANNYSLPLAASGTRGGVQLGYSTSGKNYAVQQSGEKLYVNVPWTDTTYSDATTSTHGLMSTADKSKLNGIASGANNYSLPLAANGTRGGVQVGYTTSGKNYAVQLSGEKMYVNVPWTDTTYSAATTSAAGLMSAADKSKLDGIASGAQKNNLNYLVEAIYFSGGVASIPAALSGKTILSVMISNESGVFVAGISSGHVYAYKTQLEYEASLNLKPISNGYKTVSFVYVA